MLTIFIRTSLIPFFTRPIISGLMFSSLKVNVLFKYSMVEARKLMKFRGISAEYIYFIHGGTSLLMNLLLF